MNYFEKYNELLTDGRLENIDPFVHKLIQTEHDRQAKKLILIPSESIAPPCVRKALGSIFNNVYAEGYPREEMTDQPESNLQDLADRLTHYRRYANRRFYKGTEYVDLVESLAQQRAKQCFATDEVSSEEIYVNVQPLSGTAANLAIYETFVDPGDTVMGMALDQGGHLSHGSKFNLTGKRYNIVSYSTNRETGRLDYDEIRKQATKQKPEMIIAGYTSYSWAPDWDKFRSIADEVGAVLLADISHTAGMAIAGAYPNPIGKADVVMTTTHKTIFGPRGAIILTTNKKIASRIDEAIFPGSQGGPHPNKFAAMATALKIAQTEQFKKLQHKIVENATTLASALQEEGLTLAYGGTDTHLMVIDLTKIEYETEFTLMGEVASRILDLTRIVTNKNTIPGDRSAAVAHGLRIGTPWITQRGMGREEMQTIAQVIAKVLKSLKPFSYIGLTGPLSRGKIDLDVMTEARSQIAHLVQNFPPFPLTKNNYPHLLSPGEGTTNETASIGSDTNSSRAGLIKIRGHRPLPFLNQLCSRNLHTLNDNEGKTALLLDKRGNPVDQIEIIKLNTESQFLVITHREKKEFILDWFRGIADGYVIFDDEDIMRKVEGPVIVEDKTQMDDQVCIGPLATSELKKEGKLNFSSGEKGSVGEYIVNDLRVRGYISEIQPQNSFLWGSPKNINSLQKSLGTASQNRQTVFTPGEEIKIAEFVEQNPALFDFSKPYFVGQLPLERSVDSSLLPPEQNVKFTFSEKNPEQLRKTALHKIHKDSNARMAEFAGWEMPFWYSTVVKEHRAVRNNCGLFDVGHMGVIGIYGPGATSFLDLVTSNYVRWLEDKQAQYTYLLDPQGTVIDDGMVYRLNSTSYILVVNAVNEEKDWEWLKAVNANDLKIDTARPWIKPEQNAELINLKQESAGEKRKIDLAIQGPTSRKVLDRLISNKGEKHRIQKMKRNELDTFKLDGIDAVVARTGYTGEEIGYELLIHPENAPQLWKSLLDKGEKFGIKPVGLGARDSTRVEAGLPLYEHELEGHRKITPTEAGFGAYIKFHKPYFIGRDRYKEKAKTISQLKNKVIRFKITATSPRMIREETPVFDDRGNYLGRVTSCAKTGETQIGMAYIKKGPQTKEGAKLQMVPSLAGEDSVQISLSTTGSLPQSFEAEIISRFTKEEEGIPGMRAGE